MKQFILSILLIIIMIIYFTLAHYFGYWALIDAPITAIVGLFLGIKIQTLAE